MLDQFQEQNSPKIVLPNDAPKRTSWLKSCPNLYDQSTCALGHLDFFFFLPPSANPKLFTGRIIIAVSQLRVDYLLKYRHPWPNIEEEEKELVSCDIIV